MPPAAQVELNSSNAKCLICFENTADAVLMLCGHGGICYKCASEMASKSRDCFLCRQPIVEILEVEQNQNPFIKVISKTKVLP